VADELPIISKPGSRTSRGGLSRDDAIPWLSTSSATRPVWPIT